MAWFYEIDDRQVGPVNDDEMDKLITSRVISLETRVWTDGMDDWEPVINTDLKSKFPALPPLNNPHYEDKKISMDTPARKVTYHLQGKYIKDVASHVEEFLMAEQLDTQVLSENNRYIIQGVKEKWWRKALGVEYAATIFLEVKGNDLEVSLGARKWEDKVIGAALGWFVFAPAFFTAGWGFYMQEKLFKDIPKSIEKYLSCKN